jgi:NADPH:quinone reductase-like Zn-dependent oxidoreductase
LNNLRVEQIAVPPLGDDEVLVAVHAAGITRDELTWPADRLPATPSYELSGVVMRVADKVAMPAIGDEVYGLTPFDRDGVASEYATVPAGVLAARPRSLGHVQAAALTLAGLTAWQGLFVHGRLQAGERVLIHGASGGVGHLATQLARWRDAHVVGTATGAGVERAYSFGADEVIDRDAAAFEDAIEPVDLVFDTVGGDTLARSKKVLGKQGRLVSVAEEPGQELGGSYFVVEPNRDQIGQLATLADEGAIRTAIDSTFPLDEAVQAFERVVSPGKQGKVVLEVAR